MSLVILCGQIMTVDAEVSLSLSPSLNRENLKDALLYSIFNYSATQMTLNQAQAKYKL